MQSSCKRIHVTIGDSSSSDSADGHDPAKDVEYGGEDDAAGENPACVFDGYFGLDLARPFVVG